MESGSSEYIFDRITKSPKANSANYKTFIKKIYLGVKKDNIRAIKAYKKNGFKIKKKTAFGYIMLLNYF